jgi:hypothetical protein
LVEARVTSIWTPDRDEQLVKLWMQASPRLSLTDIAIIMRLSKNQVVGRGHRLAAKGRLVPRESPIKPVAVSADKRQRQAVSRDAALIASARRAAVPASSVAAPPPAPVVRALSPHRRCQWIHGEAAGAQSRWCDAPSISGSSYCAAHHARCHTTRPQWAA